MSITWIPKRMQVQTSMEIFKATGRQPFLGCACGRYEPLPRRFLGKSRRALTHVHLLWPVHFPQMLCPPGAWQCASHSGLPSQVPGYGTLTGEGRSFASAKQKRLNVKEPSCVCGLPGLPAPASVTALTVLLKNLRRKFADFLGDVGEMFPVSSVVLWDRVHP